MTSRETVQTVIDRGIARHKAGDLDGAAECYRAVLSDQPRNPAALQLLGLVARGQGEPARAETLMRQSLRLDPRQAHVWANLARLLKRQERLADAIDGFEHARPLLPEAKRWQLDLDLALTRARAGRLQAATAAFEAFFFAAPKPNFANLNDLCNLYNLTGQPGKADAALRRFFPNRTPPGPTGDVAFFFSLPKSAGTSIAQSVAQAAQRPHAATGVDEPGATAYSAGLLFEPLLRYLGGVRAVVQGHALPRPETVALAKRYGGAPLFVHVRDPRDALVSYYHMAEEMDLHRMRLVLADPGYAELDAPAKLRWLKTHVYPTFVAWIRDWVALADGWDGPAHVGSFETFVQDKQGYVAACANRLDGKARPVDTVRQTHMRQGRSGSAAEAFTETEMAEMLAQIPADLRARFGWA